MQTIITGMRNKDGVLYGIMNRTKMKYMTVRIIYDLVFIGTGYLLGGIVGIGSLFSLTTMGYFTVVMKRLIIYIRNKNSQTKTINPVIE